MSNFFDPFGILDPDTYTNLFGGGGGGGDDNNNESESSGTEETPGIEAVDYNAMYEAMANMYSKISSMNEDKFNKYWPQSINQGIAAGSIFDAAGQAQAVAAQKFNINQADEMNSWLTKMTTAGNDYMRSEAGKSNQWIMGQVADVNKFNSDQFYTALEKAMPGIMSTAGEYKGSVDAMLSGELPSSVKNEIAQAAAERGLSSGVYGPAQDNAQLRDLGIERLKYVQAGQAQMPTLIGVTQALTAPVATPNIYQNVMMTPTPYTPGASYSTPSNIPGIAGNYLTAVMNGTMMQPAAGLNSVAQMAQISSQQNIANTELQYANKWSQLNYDQQQSMFDQQMSAAKEQNWWNLAGSVLGAGTTLTSAGIMSGNKNSGVGSIFGSLY